MNELIKKINRIEKSYFNFSDLRKITDLDDASLRVTVSRMIKSGEIISINKGYYKLPEAILDLPKITLEIYAPSYLSFEWALGQNGILSQKTYSLTLATTKRARQININDTNIIYRHIQQNLFFGYILKEGYLIAEPEKAFLDLAYLSLNGYANFDVEEMNLEVLDKKKIKMYLKKFNSKKLEQMIARLAILS